MLAFVQAHFDQILTFLGALVALAIAYVRTRPWAQAALARYDKIIKDNRLEAVELLAASVAQRVYQDEVRYLKERNKWDADAKRAVFNKAVEILKEECKSNGLSILATVLPGIMQKAVNLLKADGKAASAEGAI